MPTIACCLLCRSLKIGKNKDRSGFTLVELMVVIMIAGILAAVAVPLLRGRIDSAKWSEGMAMMGTVATALDRATCLWC